MKNIQTLHRFITNYYKSSSDKSEARFLLAIVNNMQISNCTVGKVKEIIKKSLGTDTKNIEITAEDIISFLHDENNITKIQEETSHFGLYPTSASLDLREFKKYSGQDNFYR